MTTPKGPMPGRCNATRRGGGVCHAYPVPGQTRCKRHGGTRQQAAAWTRGMSDAGREEIQKRISDPGLFDAKRPVALAEYVATSAPLVPDEAHLEALARRAITRQVGPELLESIGNLVAEARKGGVEDLAIAIEVAVETLLKPTEADLAAARLEWADRSIRIAARYAKTQQEAIKVNEWGAAVRDLVVPVLSEFAIAMGVVLRRHVPPDRLEAAVEDTRRTINTTVGRLTALRDGAT